MKISELTTKSFLGNAGAAANSYVLINYEDNSTSEPITYKASLQELGKAIANDQQLYKKTANGAVTTSVNNSAYADGTAEKLVTASEKTLLSTLATDSTNPVVQKSSYLGLKTGEADAVPYIMMYNSSTEEIGYYETTSSDSWVAAEIGGATQAYAVEVSNEHYFSAFLNEDGALTTFSSNEEIYTIGYPVVYNSDEGAFGYYASNHFVTVSGITVVD